MSSKFIGEKDKVERLMQRLGVAVDSYECANSRATGESGADVIAVCSGHRIGIQVTDLDTGEEPGQARRDEKKIAQEAKSRNGTYCAYAQNDINKITDAITRSISRKSLTSFAGFDEFWLLVCCGVPEAIVSTLVMTFGIDTASLDKVTLDMLSSSKYTRAFIYAIMGPEEKAIYEWERGGNWRKSVLQIPENERGASFWDIIKDPEKALREANEFMDFFGIQWIND